MELSQRRVQEQQRLLVALNREVDREVLRFVECARRRYALVEIPSENEECRRPVVFVSGCGRGTRRISLARGFGQRNDACVFRHLSH